MFKLNCIECGYTWESGSADVKECPMCDGRDVVVITKDEKEVKNG